MTERTMRGAVVTVLLAVLGAGCSSDSEGGAGGDTGEAAAGGGTGGDGSTTGATGAGGDVGGANEGGAASGEGGAPQGEAGGPEGGGDGTAGGVPADPFAGLTGCELVSVEESASDLSPTDRCAAVYACADDVELRVTCDGENDGADTSLCTCHVGSSSRHAGAFAGEGEEACLAGVDGCFAE